MNTQTIIDCLHAVSDAIIANESEIEALDREIGDGDHLINVKRGCSVLLEMRDQLAPLSVADAFTAIGTKLLGTIGGASGPLISSFFIAAGKVLKTAPASQSAAFADAFAAGVEAIRNRGKADVGEKTMLDVLIPVARLLSRLAEEGSPLDVVCAKTKDEAQRGMLATKDMIASKGRAYFLGERAIGHIDPGSKTSQVAIWAVCDKLLAVPAQQI